MTMHFGPDRATFIHIPKCAGSSIKTWGNKIPGIRGGPKHIKVGGAKQMFKTPGRFFAVVRNPYDRAVSLFHFCGQLGQGKINLGGWKPPVYDVWRDMYALGLLHFLQRTRAHDAQFDTSDRNWHHWDSQWSWISSESDTIILRHEHLADDFRLIQDLLNCHGPLPLINQSQHDHYETYLDPDVKLLIQDIWAEDFKRFGYPV
jgi:hypothetical protein